MTFLEIFQVITSKKEKKQFAKFLQFDKILARILSTLSQANFTLSALRAANKELVLN